MYYRSKLRDDCIAEPKQRKQNPSVYQIRVGDSIRGELPHWLVESSNDWKKISLTKSRWYRTLETEDSDYKIGRFTGEYDDNDKPIFDNVVSFGYIYEFTPLKGLHSFKRIEEIFEATDSLVHKVLDVLKSDKGLTNGAKIQLLGDCGNIVIIAEYLGSKYDRRTDTLLVYSDISCYVKVYQSGKWVTKLEDTNFVLITEDNVGKHIGDKVWVFYPGYENYEQITIRSRCPINREAILFDSVENIHKYIELHENQYSDADLDWLVKKVEYDYESGVNAVEALEEYIDKLKKSK